MPSDTLEKGAVDALQSAIAQWEWWHVGLILGVLVLIWRSPKIIDAISRYRNERRKDMNKHEQVMKRLENQSKKGEPK